MNKPLNELREEIERLLRLPIAEKELRARLEPLTAHPLFGTLSPVWGPRLYRRDRVFWRPFILQYLSIYERFGIISWKRNAPELDPWLESVDASGDVELFRRLYNWKLDSSYRTFADSLPRWKSDVLNAFRNAATGPARSQVLTKYSSWRHLDEATAIALYAVDPQLARPFILKHLPEGSWSGGRKLWRQLSERARGDEELFFALFRRQASLDEWRREIAAISESVADPAALVEQLRKRHLEGWNLDYGPGFHDLLERRGRDVFPYVLPRIAGLAKGWGTRGSVSSLLKLAIRNQWTELWASLIRTAVEPAAYVTEIERLVDDRTSRSDGDAVRLLLMLTGASHEWNFGPFSFSRVHPLPDRVAVKLYERFPDLLRGAFKMNVGVRYGTDYPQLTRLVLRHNDETLLDYLASRAAMHVRWGSGPAASIELLADFYKSLVATPDEFARRAAAALTQMPAFGIWNYDQLLRENRLARILFERTEPLFLNDPRSVRDLLESPQIHVQALAFRVLGLDDPRAAAIGAASTDLLQAALFRPLRRRTRLMAFAAIERAASTETAARYLAARIREAFGLPEERYPREQLIGLLGQLLHRWPQLRHESEQPVIHGAAR